MSKKMMVSALAVVSTALFALPAVASAQSWHLGSSTANFTVTGSGGSFTSTAGGGISCTSTMGNGAFSTSTGGSVSLALSGCKGPLGVSCTSAGQATGVVVASMAFDAIMVATNKPGTLFTPVSSAEPTVGLKTLWEMSCFGLAVKVFGKGLIATISAPACGVASSTSTLTFGSTAQTGHQEDKVWTGSSFDLTSTLTGSHPTFSLDASWTLTFFAPQTRTCTH